MDGLPQELLDRVMKERAAGRTWMEIESLSPKFEEWERTTPEVRAEYQDLRLPHTTLQRWYDLRVEQVKKEVRDDQVKARELAGLFADKEFKNLPEVVRTALGDKIFAVLKSSDDKSQIKNLMDFGWLLTQYKRLDIQEKKVEAETTRVSILEREFEMRKKKFDQETDKAARKAARGKAITTDDINRIRERTFGLPPIAGSTAA